MIARGGLRGWKSRIAVALLLSTLGLGYGVPSALAATLAVRVSPSPIHLRSTYRIQISGSFNGRRGYLVAFIQYSSKQCKAGVSQELYRTHDTGGAFYAGTIRRNPFQRSRWFHARSRSTRRVCAYLFSRRVKPGTHVNPLARASVLYSVVS